SAAGTIPRHVGLALGGGGVLVATIGWADDRTSQSATLRLLVQCFAAVWAVYWLHGLPSIRFGQFSWHLGTFGSLLAVLGIIWTTNLYNFMDGVDGIASGEAVTAGAFGGLLLLL